MPDKITVTDAVSSESNITDNATPLETQLAALKQEKSQLEQRLRESAKTRGEAGTKAQAQIHSAAINIARERVIADFKKEGIEPVMKPNGEIDYKATLARVGGKAGGNQEENNKPDREKEELRARLQAVQDEQVELEARVQRAEEDRREKIVELELGKIFGRLPVIDQEDAITLFRSKYAVRPLPDEEGGALRVFHGAEMVMNGQSQARVPANLKDVAEQFIKEKPHLLKPTARSGDRGTPQQIATLRFDAFGAARPSAEYLEKITGRGKKK